MCILFQTPVHFVRERERARVREREKARGREGGRERASEKEGELILNRCGWVYVYKTRFRS